MSELESTAALWNQAREIGESLGLLLLPLLAFDSGAIFRTTTGWFIRAHAPLTELDWLTIDAALEPGYVIDYQNGFGIAADGAEEYFIEFPYAVYGRASAAAGERTAGVGDTLKISG